MSLLQIRPALALSFLAALSGLSAVACSTEATWGDSTRTPDEVELASGTISPPAPEPRTAEPDAAPEPLPPPYAKCPADRWCSALYPPSWKASAPPDSEGRVLHDFSFAGYRNGERPKPKMGPTFDVVASFGANASGTTDATNAIQSAINAASAAGGVVLFPAGTFRIDGLLRVAASNVVLRGAGRSTVLRFTKVSGMTNKAHLTIAGAVTREASRTLATDASSRSNEVRVANTLGLQPGDDVAIGWTVTPAFVAEHGMTGTWTVGVGEWVPFFRRKIVAIDRTVTPHRVSVDVPLRYPAKVRDGASIQKETGYLREVGVEHLAVTNAGSWTAAWAETRAHVLAMKDVADGWIDDVHSVAPPGSTDPGAYHLQNSGILVSGSKRVSVLSSSMANPQNRGGGGAGYLFEWLQTSEVLFADCDARNGRHNFIQNWGFGSSGTVLLRSQSSGSATVTLVNGKASAVPAKSEHHHALGMATLVDNCRLDDGFYMGNRGDMSMGAGHTSTESVFWRSSGKGTIATHQYGWGYVIGTSADLDIDSSVTIPTGAGTAPEDFIEGAHDGDRLFPPSLYDDQRARRLAK